jgi:hypothetical protein
MSGRNRAADPAFDLEAKDESQQQLGARHAPQLGERQQGGRERRGRMDDGGQVGVAVVEDVGAGGVEEGGAQGIDALAAADDRRLLAAGKFGERFQGELDRFGAAAGDRHGEEVQQRALGLVAGFLRNVIPCRVDDEAGEGGSDAWSGKHGFSVILSAAKDLIAACHGHEILRCASARSLLRAR